MNIRILSYIIPLFIAGPCLSAFAQEPEDYDPSKDDQPKEVVSDSVNVLGTRVHRNAIAPYHSISPSRANVIDTLPTAVPGVNVLLYNDNTWHFSKSDEYIADSEVFKRNWNNTSTNPYNVALDSIPETWALWLVDSLSEYHRPTDAVRVTSKFGMRHGRRHQGIDIGLPVGSPLYAVFDGIVRVATNMHGYGNVMIVRHNNGLETVYGHMSKFEKRPGDIVHAGDIIGLSGNTGRSTGPHLHFESRYYGLAFDPVRIINFENGDLKQRIMVLKRRYFSAASQYDQDFDEEFLLVEDDAKALEAKRKADEEAARKAMVYHKVRNGENLGSIARKYHTTVNNICRLNGIKNPNTLRAGRTIRVR